MMDSDEGTNGASGCPPQAGSAATSPWLVNHTIFSRKAAPRARKSLESDASGSSLALADHARRNGDFAVTKVEVYRRDAVVRREMRIVGTGEGRPEGAVIWEFSDRSMRNLIFLAKNCDCDFFSMLTLTYPKVFETDGREVKRHVKLFKKSYEWRYEKRGLWWLEFQERGAPHVHVLSEVDLKECGEIICKCRRGKRDGQSYLTCQAEEDWLSRRWFEIVASGDEKHLRAGVAWEVVEKTEGALRYAAAHAGKRKQKIVPAAFRNVGRFWGKIGDIRLERVGVSTVDTVGVFEAVGSEGLSSRGRVKKYLYDAANKFSLDEI